MKLAKEQNKSKKMSFFKKLQLGFAGLTAGLLASVISVKAPTKFSSTNINSTPQQSIVEENKRIVKEKTKVTEVAKGFKIPKESLNTDNNVNNQIDKNQVTISNTAKPAQENSKFKTILPLGKIPNIAIGEVARANSRTYNGSGISSIRVCNNDSSFRIDIEAKIYPGIKSVDFKGKYGRVYNPVWGAYQKTFGYIWRHLGTLKGKNSNTYNFTFEALHNYLTYEDLLFSIHVNSGQGTIIDVGGIKNIGQVEKGKCTTTTYPTWNPNLPIDNRA